MRYTTQTIEIDLDGVYVDVETLEKYSKDEVLFELSLIKGRGIAQSTFYRWLGEAGITPKEEYKQSELDKLKKVCRHYKRRGKSKTLKL